MTRPFFFLVSWFVVAFGQPGWGTTLSALAAFGGYALFFYSVKKSPCRFRVGFTWFAAVQGVQLFWMTASTYQGSYIYLCYIGVIIALALQFGLLVRAMPKKQISWSVALGIAGIWTLLELSRLQFLCGFAFNPVGLALSANVLSLQLASLFGVFGLSFWVMLTNVLGYRAAVEKRGKVTFGVVACVPYLFGTVQLGLHKEGCARAPKQKVSLIQTGLLPDEKSFFQNGFDSYQSPFEQWVRIITLLPENPGMVVLPESVVPYQFELPIFPVQEVTKAMSECWGRDWLKALPPFEDSYARMIDGEWYVSHAFWAQAIANYYSVEVVGGFESSDGGRSYNAGFHLFPAESIRARYAKRVLVPLAEYLPTKSLAKIVANYGIIGQFTHGKAATVSGSNAPLSMSICYEECFGHLMRQGKKKGAQLYVNLTNDGWFAFSRLPRVHFDHGRPRTVENGVPLLRASNTGCSAIVDSLGRLVAMSKGEYQKEVVIGEVPLYTFRTLYTAFGDWLIFTIAICATLQYCLVLKKRVR